MKIVYGNDRMVLVFPKLGIVVKFGRIKLKQAIEIFLCYSSKRKRWWLIPPFFKQSYLEWNSFQSLMFQGIVSNQFEYKLWRKTKHAILTPTIFSFFGLFNIQEYVEIAGSETSDDFWYRLNQLADPVWLWRDKHAFSHNNYSIKNGKIKFVDYGNRTIIGTVLRFGDTIHHYFDANYRIAD